MNALSSFSFYSNKESTIPEAYISVNVENVGNLSMQARLPAHLMLQIEEFAINHANQRLMNCGAAVITSNATH